MPRVTKEGFSLKELLARLNQEAARLAGSLPSLKGAAGEKKGLGLSFPPPGGAASLLYFLAVPVLLALLALFSPAASGTLFFPLLSFWLDVMLFCGALGVLRMAKIRFDRFHWVFIGLVFAGVTASFLIQLASRDFIYCWDYANYVTRQYEAEQAFLLGPAAGLGQIFSTLADDYTSYINLFTEFPFCLTDHTPDAYAASLMVSVFPTLLLLLAGLVEKLGQIFGAANRRLFFVLALSITAACPFLRLPAALAQPDWFGLIFAFAILLLTVDYRFERTDLARWAVLFLATEVLILTRRWYLYFIVGYYFSYALLVVLGGVRQLREGRRAEAMARFKRLALFGAGSVLLMTLLLWPIVQHILSYDYAQRYAAYNVGGLLTELYYQSFRLGLFNLALMVLGLRMAFQKGKQPLAGMMVCYLAVSILLFTRVQNMGAHQTLLLVPGYFALIIVGVAALLELAAHRQKLLWGGWACLMVLSLTVRLSPLTIVALPEPIVEAIDIQFTQLDDLIYDRTDRPGIEALAEWIDANCAEGEQAYIIPHSMPYNPDVFLNYALPEKPLEGKICFGFGVAGTQNFPVEIFDAKYVITADPFPWCYEVSDVAERLNNCFLQETEGYFAQVATFDMGNGTVFTVWQRTQPADRGQAERFLAAFAAEDAQFPEMFSQVIESWCAQRGL